MKKTITTTLIFCLMSIMLMAEMPEISITPENVNKQEVIFSVAIEPLKSGDLSCIMITDSPKSTKYGKVEEPCLYLYSGNKIIAFVALHTNEVKADEPLSYWCYLSKNQIISSIITVSCCPTAQLEGIELCAQSMGYTLKIKDFVKKE